MADHSPYQKKIIRRYYQNFDAIKYQRLSELVTELYLAEGKKSERLWKQVGEVLRQLGLAEARVEHLLSKREVSLLPSVLKEFEEKG